MKGNIKKVVTGRKHDSIFVVSDIKTKLTACFM
jgi:hypothetical protein